MTCESESTSSALFIPSIPTSLYKCSSVRIYFVGLQPGWCVPPPRLRKASGERHRGVWRPQCLNHIDRRHGPLLQAPSFSGNGVKPSSEMVLTESETPDGFLLLVCLFMKQQQKQTQSARPERFCPQEPTHQQHGNEAQPPQGGVLIGREFCDKVGNTCRDCRSPCPSQVGGGDGLPPEFNLTGVYQGVSNPGSRS